MFLAKKYWKDFSYFFSLSEPETLDVISSSSFEIFLLSVRFELTNEKLFSVSSEMVCSYLTEASEVTTKFFFRVLCLISRESYFSIISNREAFNSEGVNEESTSSSSSESYSASGVGSASDSASVLAISAIAACSSSESSSSDSESSQVAISPFLPLWNFLGFLSFFSFGHSFL